MKESEEIRKKSAFLTSFMRRYVPGDVCVILYGSRARGEEGEHSDVDSVVVLFGREEYLQLERRVPRLIDKWRSQFPYRLSLQTVYCEDMEESLRAANPWWVRIVSTGIALIDSRDYLESLREEMEQEGFFFSRDQAIENLRSEKHRAALHAVETQYEFYRSMFSLGLLESMIEKIENDGKMSAEWDRVKIARLAWENEKETRGDPSSFSLRMKRKAEEYLRLSRSFRFDSDRREEVVNAVKEDSGRKGE